MQAGQASWKANCRRSSKTLGYFLFKPRDPIPCSAWVNCDATLPWTAQSNSHLHEEPAKLDRIRPGAFYSHFAPA
uniref:Uncharacterized protein n=1 Tax=Nothoprocta perdicaria TaxID=30464 RepID=A0A8C7E7Z3_NOTPE